MHEKSQETPGFEGPQSAAVAAGSAGEEKKDEEEEIEKKQKAPVKRTNIIFTYSSEEETPVFVRRTALQHWYVPVPHAVTS
jgi:hypothetical protein